MIAKANTYHRPDVKTAILHLAGNPSVMIGTIAIVDPVTTTNHIKVLVHLQAVKTVVHLFSNHSRDATIILRPLRQCRLMAVRHHSNNRHQMWHHSKIQHRPHPPIPFASNKVQPDMVITMMITDGVVEEELVIEVVTEEIIMLVRTYLSFAPGT